MAFVGNSILTTYVGPTNTQPGRIRAVGAGTNGKRLIRRFQYEHCSSVYDNHRMAAEMLYALVRYTDFEPTLIAGYLPGTGSAGYAWVPLFVGEE